MALSVSAFAGPLSGQWSVWGTFEYDANEAVTLVDYESLLEIDYTTCGWTFTGSALFAKHYFRYLTSTVGGALGAFASYSHCFKYLWFTAGGSVGAIDFYSALTFGVPSYCGAAILGAPLGIDSLNGLATIQPAMDFLSLISSARMSIAGVDLFGIFAVLKQYELLDNFNHVAGFGPKINGYLREPTIGAGLLLGGSGSAGDCDICVQVGFNLWRLRAGNAVAPCVCHYGWEWVLPTFTPIECCDGWIGPDCLWWVDPNCCMCFSSAEICLKQPFACFDLTVDVLFSCDYGFDSVSLTLCDICLGLPWLELGALEVVFSRALGDNCALEGSYQKYVSTDFDLILADCVCFTPYLFVDVDNSFVLDGIGLAALTVEYDTGQGVTFKAGDRFGSNEWLDWQNCQRVDVYAFTETGDVVMWTDDMYCDMNERVCLMPWDEYIGFMIDGDSCCGGHFDAWIFAWFNGDEVVVNYLGLDGNNPMMAVGPTAPFMDLREIRGKLAIDIGRNFTLMLKVSLTTHGLNWFTVGAETRW
jgi:hypothetical protein